MDSEVKKLIEKLRDAEQHLSKAKAEAEEAVYGVSNANNDLKKALIWDNMRCGVDYHIRAEGRIFVIRRLQGDDYKLRLENE